MSNRLRSGFTLPELLVSAVILAVVSVYLADLLTRQSRTYAVVDQVTEIQHNLRAIAHLMEREIRTTGVMVPEAAAFCGADNTNTSDAIFLSDGDAIAPGLSNDLGAEVQGSFAGSDTSVQLDDVVVDGDPFYDTDLDGVADSDFQVGGGVIFVDPDNPALGAQCGQITAINVGAGTLGVDYTRGGTDIVSSNMKAIPAQMYWINGFGQLVRNGTILADDVEDLQFAAFYDVDEDDVIDSDALEYPGSDAGDIYESDNWNNSRLRELRVSFVVRTRMPDPEFTTGQFQAVENRTPPAGNDGFRRRVHTIVVRPRNVGQRQGV